MATQPAKPGRPGSKTFAVATVSSAATGLSDIINCSGLALHSVHVTSSWTAATITFMGSAESTLTMGSVRHTTAGIEYTLTSTSAQINVVDPFIFNGLRFLQVRSGSTTTPVAQADDRPVTLGFNSI